MSCYRQCHPAHVCQVEITKIDVVQLGDDSRWAYITAKLCNEEPSVEIGAWGLDRKYSFFEALDEMLNG